MKSGATRSYKTNIIMFLVLMTGCIDGPAVQYDSQKNHVRGEEETDELTSQRISEVVSSRLQELRWTAKAAGSFAQCNQFYLGLLYQEDMAQFEQTINILGRLGPYKVAQNRLVEMPELAGLLAGSLEQDENGPALILQSIPSGPDRDVVMSLYCLAATPVDCVSLAKTLRTDRDIIVRLYRHNALDAVAWFMAMPENPDVATIYREWLRSVLLAALDSSDEADLDRAQVLLAIHAPVVRQKLEEDKAFREKFLSEYWPNFRETLNEQTDELGWGIFVFEAGVWDFYEEFDLLGEKLYRRHGPICIDLSTTPEYQSCRKQVISALEAADELTIKSLCDDGLRKQPFFIELLKRDLPGGSLAKALHLLGADPSNSPTLLRQWNDLSNGALIEELGPAPDGVQTWLPGYNLYYLAKKKAQGREVTNMDLVFAAVDTVEIVFMAKGAGKSLKVIQQGVRKQAQTRGLKEVAEGSSKLTARQLYPWVLQEGQRISRQHLRPAGLNGMVDITGPVRFAFEKSGLGRSTFRRLSGLEARVFMRADRQVAVDLGDLVSSEHLVGRALRESAVNAGFDTTLKSETGRQAVEAVAEAGGAMSERSKGQLQAWKEHLSVWWLAGNTGGLETIEASGDEHENLE